MEDDLTVAEMRREPEKPLPFMSAGELLYLRTKVMRVTQSRLCEQLISPSTGAPVSASIMSLWEKGRRPIPLWVARRTRDIAAAIKVYDEKRANETQAT
jgi:hypothetical protein